MLTSVHAVLCVPLVVCSRESLFNIIIGLFLSFYGSFALLYPHHEALHFNGLAEQLVVALPTGLSGVCLHCPAWLSLHSGFGCQELA